MSANCIILPYHASLDHHQNRKFFLDMVRNTVGFNETAKEDKLAYIAGAGMMFDKLAPYAQLRIAMEEDHAQSIKNHSSEHESNLREIARILKQYGDE